jgi:hypothetical protein
MPLLNYYSQTKMAKGEKLGYKTAILHFAPYDMSGKNVCPKATLGPGGCVKPLFKYIRPGPNEFSAAGSNK